MTDQERQERSFLGATAGSLYSRCTPDSLIWLTAINKSTGEKVLLAVCRGTAAETMKTICRDMAELYKGEVREATRDALGDALDVQ